MSRWWPERQIVALRPEAAAVAGLGAFGRRPALRAVDTWEPVLAGTPSWEACLDALGSRVSWQRRGAVSVVLSNHFCHFALLDRPQAVVSDAEALAYAKNRMQALYGVAAGEWDCVLSASGRRLLVCATPRALLDQVRRRFAERKTRVASIQPYFSAAWKRRSPGIRGRNAWFVVHEPKRVVAGLIVNGSWAHLAARRSGDTLDDVLDVLDRERELAGERGAERAVWLCAPEIAHVPPEQRGYRLHVLAPPRLGQVEIGKRTLYAMAA